ncbi:MAG: hypothetical protein ACK4NO_08515, partial [Glycocaulis sp.]
MQADSPDHIPPPGESEPIDAEFEPAKPEKRSGGGKAAMRLAGFVLLLMLAGGAGGVAGWFAAGLNGPDAPAADAGIARLESQIAGMEARLNAAEDRSLSEMVPTEALRTFDSDIRALDARLEAVEARPAGEAGAGIDEAMLDARLDERDAAIRAELDTLRSVLQDTRTRNDQPADLRP